MVQEAGMPQLHLYVPDETASLVRQRARALKMSVSGYLAELVRREVASGWPEGFFDETMQQEDKITAESIKKRRANVGRNG